MIELLFWGSLALVGYAQVGHVLAVRALAAWRPKPWRRAPCTPSVAVYVSAFNEEQVIADKIRNLLAQDYSGVCTIVVVDDCSTDGTGDAVRAFAGEPRVQLVVAPENRGKAANQNAVVPGLEVDIVVFSDATSFLPPDGIRRICEHFSDPQVGAVGVDLNFRQRSGSGVEQGQGGYWRIERKLRTWGALVWTNVVCSGTCYAMRRVLFQPIPLDVGEDLSNPVHVAAAGYRVVFDDVLQVDEESNETEDAEFRMRRRVALRNLTGLARFWRLLHPRYGFAAYQLFGHKYLRCLSFVPLLVALLTNVVLAGQAPYGWLLTAHLGIYVLAAVGWLCTVRGWRMGRVASVPFYFLMGNAAYLLAAGDWLRGERRATWSTERSSES